MIKCILKKPYHNGMTCQGSCKNIKKRNWQRAIFAQRTIFAAMMLNFCVRYGYRCVHHAIITRSSLSSILQDTQNQIVVLYLQARLPFRSSPRPISISPLNMSPCLHSWPIYLIVFKGSYLLAQWEISSWSGFHT